jgi:hypothetical protein
MRAVDEVIADTDFGVAVIEERIVDVNLDPIERDNGLDRAAGPPSSRIVGPETAHNECYG